MLQINSTRFSLYSKWEEILLMIKKLNIGISQVHLRSSFTSYSYIKFFYFERWAFELLPLCEGNATYDFEMYTD